MSTFPIYHGITLAANSYIENLVVEKLSSDPVPVEAGRVWYNTTLKVFRQSTLDGGGAVIVRTFATVEELTANVAAETSRAQAAESSLAASILVEQTRATAAESTLQANIDAEATARGLADTTLQANINAEITRASNAEATLQTNLNNEVTRASNAESTLQANIDAEATARGLADTTLQANITSESSRALAAESSLNSAVLAETTRALTAEASLQTALNAAMSNLSWRAPAKAATADSDLNVAADGTALSTLLPFSDDESPAMVIGDFAAGDFLISKNGASSKIFTVVDDGGTLKVTTVGVDALVAGDAFVVYNDLPDSPASQEGMSLYTYSGSDIVKIGDFDWSLATGIDLSGSFISTTGVVTAGDSIEAAIAKLVGNLAAAGSDASALVAAEESRALAAEATLTANLATEVTRATAAEATLTANLAAEVTRASNAETTLTNSVLAEVTRASNAETTLQANIDAEATLRANADSTLTSNLNAEITRATAAEATLTSNLNAEITRATDAETTLTSNLNAEITRATGVEATLQANINTEITRASNAEATLQANITAEQSRAQAAESSLAASIAAEASRAQSVEGNLANLDTTVQTSLVDAINEVVTLVGGGTEAVRDAIDATVFTYDSAVDGSGPATEHIIAHALNYGFVDVGVWIKRADGSYYNDIVSVKVNSNNQITVYLSTAQDVKVICRSAKALGLIA